MVLNTLQCLLPESNTPEYLWHLPPIAFLPFQACTTPQVDLSPHLSILYHLQRLEDRRWQSRFNFIVSSFFLTLPLASAFVPLIGSLLRHLGPETHFFPAASLTQIKLAWSPVFYSLFPPGKPSQVGSQTHSVSSWMCGVLSDLDLDRSKLKKMKEYHPTR